MGKDILKETEKYKITSKTKISEDGESVVLTIGFNDDLIKFLKLSLGEGDPIEEVFNFSPLMKFKRNRIKTAVFKNLRYSYPGLLFNCDLMKTGHIDIYLSDVLQIENIKDSIRRNIKELIKFFYSLDEEQIISFKIENHQNEDNEDY